MRLTDQQAILTVTKPAPAHQKALKRAQDDNNRQRYHAQPATDLSDAGPYANILSEYVKAVLGNDDKHALFLNLLRYPLPSTRLIDQAADEYLKAFGAEDRFIELNLTDDSVQADAAEFLDEIGFDDFLTKNLFNQCLRTAASIWVVDLPAEVNLTGYARPEPMLKEVGELTDIGTNRRGGIEYVTYPLADLTDDDGQSVGKRYAVLDDGYYRVLVTPKDGNTSIQLANPHPLGRTPAGFIWHDRLDEKQPLRIQSPLHALFTDLDRYVIGSIFREHADLYASFPMLWSFKSRCEYITTEGLECTEGFVTVSVADGDGLLIPQKIACPACAKRKASGPGTHLRIPQPVGADAANLREPAGFINADRQLLDYNAEKVDALEAQIREALTGDNGSVDLSTQAVNTDQVNARFEARKAILSYWASHLEETHRDLLDCLGQLRFGPQWVGCVVSYGTEFHLLSPAQAIADYQAARTAGLPGYQLISRRQRIDRLLAGASESQNTRLMMMAQLEPYPDLALMSVPSGSDAWELKANFSQYIDRFERENVGLETFGKLQPMSTRIATISQILYKYVSDNKALRAVPEAPGGGVTEKGG